MQETHSDGSDTLKWQLEWGSRQFYLNHGQSNARGTAIAFKNIFFLLMVYFVNIIFRLQFSSKANKILMTMTYDLWRLVLG